MQSFKRADSRGTRKNFTPATNSGKLMRDHRLGIGTAVLHEGFFDLRSRKNISDVHAAGHSSSSDRVLLWKRFQEFLAETNAEVTVAFRQAMIRGSATDAKAE